jgi:hypothetical protein
MFSKIKLGCSKVWLGDTEVFYRKSSSDILLDGVTSYVLNKSSNDAARYVEITVLYLYDLGLSLSRRRVRMVNEYSGDRIRSLYRRQNSALATILSCYNDLHPGRPNDTLLSDSPKRLCMHFLFLSCVVYVTHIERISKWVSVVL